MWGEGSTGTNFPQVRNEATIQLNTINFQTAKQSACYDHYQATLRQVLVYQKTHGHTSSC